MVISVMEKNEAGRVLWYRWGCSFCRDGDRGSCTVKVLFQPNPEGAADAEQAAGRRDCRQKEPQMQSSRSSTALGKFKEKLRRQCH